MLALCAALLSWPICTDGWLTYLDNPSHLAEIASLAGEGACGWSPIAFAGLSLDALHSPLLWRGMALATRAGLPLRLLYPLVLYAGLLAPAAAVFVVAKRRMPLLPAFALAWLLLIQRPALVGTASATGGMWAFTLACGILVLFADALVAPASGRRQAAILAGLLGLIGLLHLFVLVAACMLWLLAAALQVWAERRRALPRLSAYALAAALALLLSAPYWFPVLSEDFTPKRQLFPPLALLLHFVWPVDAIDTGIRSRVFTGSATLPLELDALPMVTLLAAGLLGGIAAWRRRGGDSLARIAWVFGLAVTFLVVLSKPLDLRLLGPLPWRFIYLARIGMALAAIGLSVKGPAASPAVASGRGRLRTASLLLTMALSGLFWGWPLVRHVPKADGREMAEVRALWQWLRAHPTPGRVYLQDTFMAAPVEAGLARSHVLALSHQETGQDTLAPHYGMIPSATRRALVSEFGSLFGARPSHAPAAQAQLLERVRRFAVGRVVTATASSSAMLERTGGFQKQEQLGRFTVYDVKAAALPPGPTSVPAPGVLLATVVGPGRATLTHAFHRFWRLAEAPAGARLTFDDVGLMKVDDLPPGRWLLRLEYAPPRAPWLLCLAGLVALVMLGRRRAAGPQRPRAAPAGSRAHG
jgi:hypothetical protein